MERKGQVCISYHGEKEFLKVTKFLEANGFNNVQGLHYPEYHFPIIVADFGKNVYFGSNVTCMAALASVGGRQISFTDFCGYFVKTR